MSDRPCGEYVHFYMPPQWSKIKRDEMTADLVRHGHIEACACGFMRLRPARPADIPRDR